MSASRLIRALVGFRRLQENRFQRQNRLPPEHDLARRLQSDGAAGGASCALVFKSDALAKARRD